MHAWPQVHITGYINMHIAPVYRSVLIHMVCSVQIWHQMYCK